MNANIKKNKKLNSVQDQDVKSVVKDIAEISVENDFDFSNTSHKFNIFAKYVFQNKDQSLVKSLLDEDGTVFLGLISIILSENNIKDVNDILIQLVDGVNSKGYLYPSHATWSNTKNKENITSR